MAGNDTISSSSAYPVWEQRSWYPDLCSGSCSSTKSSLSVPLSLSHSLSPLSPSCSLPLFFPLPLCLPLPLFLFATIFLSFSPLSFSLPLFLSFLLVLSVSLVFESICGADDRTHLNQPMRGKQVPYLPFYLFGPSSILISLMKGFPIYHALDDAELLRLSSAEKTWPRQPCGRAQPHVFISVSSLLCLGATGAQSLHLTALVDQSSGTIGGVRDQT